MAEVSIYQAKTNLSSLIADLVGGVAAEHVIRKRDKPVAKLVPYEAPDVSKRIGGAKDMVFLAEGAALDAHNDEIAELFGVER